MRVEFDITKRMVRLFLSFLLTHSPHDVTGTTRSHVNLDHVF
jgi:hypothetical protein